MTAEHQPTTPNVYPHPLARQAHARALRRQRNKHRYQRMEERIRDALERLEDLRGELIARLDLLQGDPDIEPGCDLEPNLAGFSVATRPGYDDAEEDRADGEPELGSQEGGHGGTRWNPTAYFWPTDGEVECEDEGCDTDTEAVCEDEGAQCEGGGGDEQY